MLRFRGGHRRRAPCGRSRRLDKNRWRGRSCSSGFRRRTIGQRFCRCGDRERKGRRGVTDRRGNGGGTQARRRRRDRSCRQRFAAAWLGTHGRIVGNHRIAERTTFHGHVFSLFRFLAAVCDLYLQSVDWDRRIHSRGSPTGHGNADRAWGLEISRNVGSAQSPCLSNP